MLNTPTIQEFDTDVPGVFAYKITGEVPKDDMRAMAEHMNDVFSKHDEVDMLLVFDGSGGASTGARFDLEVQKAQFRSLGKVRNYVVAGAPDRAQNMVELFEKLLPVDGRTFDTESEALAFLRSEQEHA